MADIAKAADIRWRLKNAREEFKPTEEELLWLEGHKKRTSKKKKENL